MHDRNIAEVQKGNFQPNKVRSQSKIGKAFYKPPHKHISNNLKFNKTFRNENIRITEA